MAPPTLRRRLIRACLIVACAAILVDGILLGLGVALYFASRTAGARASWPSLRITARYEGASPEVVEDTVVMPLEHQLTGLEGLEAMESVSRLDEATITLYFRRGTDLDTAQAAAQTRVALALPVLPDVVKQNGVEVTKGGPLPAFWLILDSPDRSRHEFFLHRYAQAELVPEVARVPGVSGVSPSRDAGPQVSVWLDGERLAARNLGVAEVIRVLREQAAAGDEAQAADDLLSLVLKSGDGQVVRLRDVAQVQIGYLGTPEMVRWHGTGAVAVAAYGDGRDTGGLFHAAVGRLSDWGQRVPPGVELHLLPGLAVPGSEAVLVEGRLPDMASRERVREAAERAAQDLERLPDPKAALLVPAVFELPADEPSAFRLYVALCPADERAWSLDEFAARARQVLAQHPDMLVRVVSPAVLSQPLRQRATVVLFVSGPEEEQAFQLAEAICDRLASEALVSDVWREYARPVPRLFVDVDREAATRLGVNLGDLWNTLQACLGELPIRDAGGRRWQVHAGQAGEFGRPWDLRAGVPDLRRLEDLKQVRVHNAKGDSVPLGAIVHIRDVTGRPFLRRVDGERCLMITASPASGVSAKQAVDHCRGVADQVRRDLGLSDAYRIGP